MTFSATANVVEVLGAKPIFVDVEKDSLLANYNEIVKKLIKKQKLLCLFIYMEICLILENLTNF